MERSESVRVGDAARIERLLENDDPGSADYASVRFAVESVVAVFSAAMLREHEVLIDVRLREALLVQDAINELAELDAGTGQRWMLR